MKQTNEEILGEAAAFCYPALVAIRAAAWLGVRYGDPERWPASSKADYRALRASQEEIERFHCQGAEAAMI